MNDLTRGFCDEFRLSYMNAGCAEIHPWISPGVCTSPCWSGGNCTDVPRLRNGKCPRYLPQFSRKSVFPYWTPKLAKTPPQLLKPFILPPWPGYKRFWRRFCLFLFYLFRLNLWKIIVNHKKIIKWRIQFCWTPHEEIYTVNI